MASAELKEAREEIDRLRAQMLQLNDLCNELYRKGASDIPRPTEPLLILVAGLFEARCEDRDILVQRLREALQAVER
jgi:hypothetical protein